MPSSSLPRTSCRAKTFDELVTPARLKRIQAFGFTPDAVKELLFHTAQSTDIVALNGGVSWSNGANVSSWTAAPPAQLLMPVVMCVVTGLVVVFGMDAMYRSRMTQFKKKLSEKVSQSVEEQQRQMDDLEAKIAMQMKREEDEILQREWLKQQQKKNLTNAQRATTTTTVPA